MRFLRTLRCVRKNEDKNKVGHMREQPAGPEEKAKDEKGMYLSYFADKLL